MTPSETYGRVVREKCGSEENQSAPNIRISSLKQKKSHLICFLSSMNFSLAFLSSSVFLLPRNTYSMLSKNATRDLELTAVAAIALAVSGLIRYPVRRHREKRE